MLDQDSIQLAESKARVLVPSLQTLLGSTEKRTEMKKTHNNMVLLAAGDGDTGLGTEHWAHCTLVAAARLPV